jgi:hypothetical protein
MSLTVLLMIVYTAIGWAVGQSVYTEVPIGTYFLLYIGGAFSQVSVAIFFSCIIPAGSLSSLITVLLLGLMPFASSMLVIACSLLLLVFNDYSVKPEPCQPQHSAA